MKYNVHMISINLLFGLTGCSKPVDLEKSSAEVQGQVIEY